MLGRPVVHRGDRFDKRGLTPAFALRIRACCSTMFDESIVISAPVALLCRLGGCRHALCSLGLLCMGGPMAFVSHNSSIELQVAERLIQGCADRNWSLRNARIREVSLCGVCRELGRALREAQDRRISKVLGGSGNCVRGNLRYLRCMLVLWRGRFDRFKRQIDNGRRIDRKLGMALAIPEERSCDRRWSGHNSVKIT